MLSVCVWCIFIAITVWTTLFMIFIFSEITILHAVNNDSLHRNKFSFANFDFE